MRWSSLAVLLLAGLLLTAGTASADLVKIRLNDGRESWLVEKPAGPEPTDDEIKNSRITVTREEFDKLYYKFTSMNVTQSHPMSEVIQVYYAQKDTDFERARKLINGGNYEGALDALTKAVGSSVPWVPQYALWEIVRIHEFGSAAKEALQAIEDLIDSLPKTKFLVEARKKAGLIHLRFLGDARSAEAEFKKIRSISGVSDSVAREVDYWLIFIEEDRAGDNRSALGTVKGKYEALLRQTEGKYRNVETLARLGIGRCLLKTGSVDEALAYFENIVRSAKGEDEQTLAGAYIGIGDSYLSQQKWLDARRAYLRVAILWEDQPEFHAKALCLAGKCFLLARDTDFKQRAYQELRRCIDWYQGSYWAQEASKLLSQAK
jgi:tetratricopeptide (TPR) repeat protein